MRNAPRLRFGHEPDSQTIGRELETKLNPWMQQLTALVGSAFTKGNSPTAVINPEAGGAEKFFLLPGRYGGQIGYGATEAEGSLVLGSTAHGTKGLVYLGDGLTTAYDEAPDRFGINTIAPEAKLHVKGEPAGFQYMVPITDTTVAIGTVNELGSGVNLWASIDDAPTVSDSDFITINSSSPHEFALTPITDPGIDAGFVLKIRCRLSAGTSNINFGLMQAAASIASNSQAASTTFTTYSFALSPAECASITNYADLRARFSRSAGITLTVSAVWLEIPAGGGDGTDGKTALFDANASQTADNTQWRNSAGTALVSITAAGRFTIESGGTMRFVPGAGADKILQSNASGDLSLVSVSGDVTQTGGVFTIANNAVTLAKMADIATARIIGRVTAGTGDPEALTGTQATTLLDVFTSALKGLAPASGGGTTNFLRADGTWASPGGGTHALLSATHSDTVASTPVRGGIIVANSTPAWAQLALGAANTVLRSDGTDPSYGAIDHNYISNRTRSVWVDAIRMPTMSGTVTYGFTGTAPDAYYRATFSSSTDRSAGFSFTVPSDYVAGTSIEAFLYFTATGTADAVDFYADFGYLSLADTDDPVAAENTLANVALTHPASATTMRIQSLGTFSTGLAANEVLRCRIARDVTQEIAVHGIACQRTLNVIGIRFDYTADM